jgi:hypothetical protein
MEVFELKKVIRPNRHMPTAVQKAFFEGTRSWEMANDSFVEWTVGEYEDCDEEEDALLKEVDDWALKNFTKGESIIILHWW